MVLGELAAAPTAADVAGVESPWTDVFIAIGDEAAGAPGPEMAVGAVAGKPAAADVAGVESDEFIVAGDESAPGKPNIDWARF